MAEKITQENQPDRWKAMYQVWIQEHKPGWIVLANRTYRVLQLADDKIEFLVESNESYYESRSF